MCKWMIYSSPQVGAEVKFAPNKYTQKSQKAKRILKMPRMVRSTAERLIALASSLLFATSVIFVILITILDKR